MDFLLEALTNWLKEMLVGGIMSNLSGMFDSVNQQVADISVQVGQTPQGWNGSIFNMIENLSNSIMVPIAGVILANTVQLQDWDGRYSRRNKEWAKTIPNENPETVRCGYTLSSHPAVLDGFIDLVREEQQHSRTQGEKTQPPRPSVRDKLKQELPAHKPAAPKKREPER